MRLLPYAFTAIVPLLLPNIPQQPQRASTGQSDSYTLRTQAKLVVLDVVVTDKKGNPVTDLTREDFQIQEDKQQQHLYSFETPVAHALPPNVVIHSTAELDRLAPNAPATVLVLDDFSSVFEDTSYARLSIEKYLRAQPRLLPQPTMLVSVDITHMTMLQDYTQDRDAVLAGLSHYKPNILTITAKDLESWTSEQINMGYRSLAQVAQATMGHPGHKNMIWVGLGLPHFSGGPKVYPGDVVVSANDALRLRAALQKVINLLVATRVTLYTIDPRGVGTGHNPFDGIASFAKVAVATGGKPAYNRNDVETVIDASMREGNDFYTLSYIPSSSSQAAGALRKIRIVMKNPSLRATTRLGYFPEPLAVQPQRQIAGAGMPASAPRKKLIDKTLVETTLVYDGIPLTLERSSTPGRVVVEMAATSLPWVDHGPGQTRTAAVEVSCISFDKNGKVLTHEGSDTQVLAPAAKAGSADVGLTLNFTPDPRATRLRIIVQATDSGKVGAANLDLTAK